MKTKIQYIVFLWAICFLIPSLSAQEFESGKISKEDFEIPLTKEEKAAPAVFLNKYRRSRTSNQRTKRGKQFSS